MFSVERISHNKLNINNSNHRRLCNITDNIIKHMNEKSKNSDFYKLKNILSIYVNDRIKALTSSEINYVIYDYGYDNAVTNYKENYKIIEDINTKMLIYNLVYNNYFIIIDLTKKQAIATINRYITANKDRGLYNKKINIKRECRYLIDKINNEINGDDAKLILNTIVEKFINKTIKNISKE
jgi:hypothetical protein